VPAIARHGTKDLVSKRLILSLKEDNKDRWSDIASSTITKWIQDISDDSVNFYKAVSEGKDGIAEIQLSLSTFKSLSETISADYIEDIRTCYFKIGKSISTANDSKNKAKETALADANEKLKRKENFVAAAKKAGKNTEMKVRLSWFTDMTTTLTIYF
jgi:hypothetical protein